MARARDKDGGLQNTNQALNWNLSSMNRKLMSVQMLESLN